MLRSQPGHLENCTARWGGTQLSTAKSTAHALKLTVRLHLFDELANWRFVLELILKHACTDSNSGAGCGAPMGLLVMCDVHRCHIKSQPTRRQTADVATIELALGQRSCSCCAASGWPQFTQTCAEHGGECLQQTVACRRDASRVVASTQHARQANGRGSPNWLFGPWPEKAGGFCFSMAFVFPFLLRVVCTQHTCSINSAI